MMVRLTKLMLVGAALVIAAAFLFVSTPARATQDDPAAFYKAKCAMCHGQAAEKKFDATKADDVLTETVLKGKTMEKPPNMPAYSEKGVTPDQAKVLVAHMKSLKQ